MQAASPQTRATPNSAPKTVPCGSSPVKEGKASPIPISAPTVKEPIMRVQSLFSGSSCPFLCAKEGCGPGMADPCPWRTARACAATGWAAGRAEYAKAILGAKHLVPQPSDGRMRRMGDGFVPALFVRALRAFFRCRWRRRRFRSPWRMRGRSMRGLRLALRPRRRGDTGACTVRRGGPPRGNGYLGTRRTGTGRVFPLPPPPVATLPSEPPQGTCRVRVEVSCEMIIEVKNQRRKGTGEVEGRCKGRRSGADHQGPCGLAFRHCALLPDESLPFGKVGRIRYCAAVFCPLWFFAA